MDSPPPSSPPAKMEVESSSHVQQTPVQGEDPTLAKLEGDVEESVRALDNLEAIVTKYFHDPASSAKDKGWLRQVQMVRRKAEKPRVTIGVLGTTGTGKSSIINALLDEERLVPTSSMRACTAVVTEISYNYDDKSRYKAEIEFISMQDWAAELSLIFGDFTDEGLTAQQAPTTTSQDTAGALAKIKAVYGIEKKALADSSPDELLSRGNISEHLGKTVTVEDNDAAAFYQKVQWYIDSPEKNRTKTPRSKKATCVKQPAPEHEVQYWPLIRVVRIYIKTAVLSTGTVIVDLPGSMDSNAARANVATSYQEKCSKLWVVAPITRAVDDRAAFNLLGNNFKRQIQMDGSLGSLSFICSKTDDINLTETHEYVETDDSEAESPEQLGDTIKELELETMKFEDQISGVEREVDDIEDQISGVEREVDDIDDQKKDLQAALDILRKSKSGAHQDTGSVTENGEDAPMTNAPDVDEESPDNFSSSTDEDGEKADIPARVLDMDEGQITQKLEDLGRIEDRLASREKKLRKELKRVKRRLGKSQAQKEARSIELTRRCIQRRNAHSKESIKRDFALGVKQIDEENAIARDPNFEPGVPLRDYEETESNLNVFCVSSKAYQKLRGRFKHDPDVNGFCNPNETEIPKLQAYCIDCTAEGRRLACQAFLNDLDQITNSLKLRFEKNSLHQLTKQSHNEDAEFFKEKVDELRENVATTISDVRKKLEATFKNDIFDHFVLAKSNAISAADETVAGWNSTEREHRLAWNSYRAICRRKGVFNNRHSEFDWNNELVQPLLQTISPGWEKVFTKKGKVSSHISEFEGSILGHVDAFHSHFVARFKKRDAYSSILSKLARQMDTYKESSKHVSQSFGTAISEEQKAINRILPSYVEKALKDAYTEACSVKGRGMYVAMKEIISERVTNSRTTMFNDGVKGLREKLDKVLETASQELDNDMDHLVDNIHRDFENMFQKSQTKKDRALSREISSFLKDVERIRGAAPASATIQGHTSTIPTACSNSEGVKEEDPDTP